ncbi:MAG: hypothetical protein MZV65_20415 [Chromatiales bacterium]|nr:hypothetical protein [Chromatiales bacterium]
MILYTSTTQADQLARDIRHAQTLAISWGLPLRVSVNAAGTAYSVVCVNGTGVAPCVAAGNTVTDPVTGQAYTVTLPAGITLAPVGSNTDLDNLGRPVAGGALVAANPARTFAITGGGNTATCGGSAGLPAFRSSLTEIHVRHGRPPRPLSSFRRRPA